jgi:hypothetical protein
MYTNTFHTRLKTLKRKTRPNTYPYHAYELLLRDTWRLSDLEAIKEVVERYGQHWWLCQVRGYPGAHHYLAVYDTVKQLLGEKDG